MLRLHADWLLTPQGWRRDWEIALERGQIVAVGPAAEGARRLSGQALLAGRVNAHSHAFQRLLRGRTEYRHPQRPHDDFWSWRELMYQAAMRLNPEQLEKVARLLYLEMLESGMTTVGEFHYQHHQADGQPYQDPDELARRLEAAASWAGMNFVLLRCAYHRAGFQVAPNPLQIRFLDAHWEDALAAVERARSRGWAVGLAPHSVRAVPGDWLEPLAEYARKHSLPVHMHVSEQPKEIEQCLAETGLRPVQLLKEKGLLGPDFTAVHAIHLVDEEVAALAGSTVCSCPTTERNLGDGIVAADRLRQAGTAFCLGTDSQCQLDLWEDARQLDYHLRLQVRQRAVLDQPCGTLDDWLLQVGSQGGGRALGQPCGSLQVGWRGDLVALDLNHPQLVGPDPHGLAWSASPAAVSQVWVKGQERLQEGIHPRRAEAVAGYREVLRELADG